MLNAESTSGDLDTFITFVVQGVLRDEPLDQLYAIADQLGPLLLPGDSEDDADDASQRVVHRALARFIAEQTPRPQQRYSRSRLPRPGRNDPCECGSGHKYKRCCQVLGSAVPDEEMNLLPYVLDALPRKQWAELAGSAIDARMVADTAAEWIEEGRYAEVVALLEPWFKTDAPIPHTHELLLNLLLEAYTALGNPRKKKRLLEAGLKRGDRAIRSSAMQRLAMIAADDGDLEAAWRHFHAAQREHPDSVSLSHLEVSLLMTQGDVERARERAQFWALRLSRADANEYAELIAFLQRVAERGEAAMLDLESRDWPELEILRELIAQAPAPENLHQLEGGDGETAGYIVPASRLQPVLTRWQQSFPQVGPPLTVMVLTEHPAWDDSDEWLPMLQSEPLLWQSLDVLDDLVLALSAVPAFGIEATLGRPLLARAEALFELLLQAQGPEVGPIEWSFQQNRPALRLLAQAIALDPECVEDATPDRIERLLKINPGDNHGFRTPLMMAYLHRGQFDEAERLGCEHEYDNELQFGRILALWGQERKAEALQVLQAAHSNLPLLLPMLAADNPRKPAVTPGVYTYGGADQAWLFREQHRTVWEAVPGALDWLRQAKRALK